MKNISIRINSPEINFVEEAVSQFNNFSGYLDKISVKTQGDHYTLLIPVAESAMFVESYLNNLPVFSKERLRREIIKALKEFLDKEPNNLPAQHSLTVIQDLSS
jgi:hypothetical protein